MADHLPLLVFPRAQTIPPPKGQPGGANKLHLPTHARQVERLAGQIADLESDFNQYKGSVSSAIAGFEPETVLVIEIAGSVENFKQAVDATEGLEWLAEWKIEDIEPVEDIYIPPKIGVKFFVNRQVTDKKEVSKEIQKLLCEQGYIDDKDILQKDDVSNLRLPQHLTALKRDIIKSIDKEKKKLLSGRLFVSMVKQRGMEELLALWQKWENGTLKRGKTKWRDVFAQTLKIRRWGIQETLYESGMIDRWKDLLDRRAD